MRGIAWKKYTGVLLDMDNRSQGKFWCWVHNRLAGLFAINTRHGSFGISFRNFNIYFGNFFRLNINWHRCTFLLGFGVMRYGEQFSPRYLFGHEFRTSFDNRENKKHSIWYGGRYNPGSSSHIIKRGKFFCIGKE